MLALLLATALLASAPASAAGPSLSAKSSGLSPAGATISVTGSGFTPKVGLFLATCDPAVPAGGACDLTNFKQLTTNASGGFTASIKVIAKFGKTDCTKVKCVLETNDPANPTSTKDVATLAVSFASTTPPKSTTPSKPSSPTTDPAPPASTTSPALPKGTDAGKADTNSQLLLGVVGVAVALSLFTAGGVLYYRRSSARP
ncbi:MAG: neocarzinostatin apoprotein domain-containing protein [Jatrophihabitantaceae bacterium]